MTQWQYILLRQKMLLRKQKKCIESFIILMVSDCWSEKTAEVSRRVTLATNEVWVVIRVGWTSFPRKTRAPRDFEMGKGSPDTAFLWF